MSSCVLGGGLQREKGWVSGLRSGPKSSVLVLGFKHEPLGGRGEAV